jgi:hypothetical protein
MAISKSQLALIGVARKRLALDEDTYRDILHAVAGVESARDLDWIGFTKLMERFKALGFESDWSQRTFGNRRGMATPAQIDTIRRMWEAYAVAPGEAGLNAWLQRTAKVSALRFLDADGAHKAINGLRAMIARKTAGAPHGGDAA